MKRLSVLCITVLTVMLLTLAACSSNKPVEPVEGFDYYENADHFIRMQYPSEWYAFDSTLTGQEAAEYADLFGPEFANFLENADFSTIAVIWYDMDNTTDGFTPNVNLNITAETNIRLKDLKSVENQQQLQAVYESYFPEILYNFKPRGDIEGKTFGNHYFLVYQYDCTLNDIPCTFYQATTLRDDKNQMLVFSFTTTTDRYTASVPVYEKMLSTVEYD